MVTDFLYRALQLFMKDDALSQQLFVESDDRRSNRSANCEVDLLNIQTRAHCTNVY